MEPGIVFERAENIDNPHGGYNLFVINADGTGRPGLPVALTPRGWQLVSLRKKITYVVGRSVSRADIYLYNERRWYGNVISPDIFRGCLFLCHSRSSQPMIQVILSASVAALPGLSINLWNDEIRRFPGALDKET